MPSDRTPLWLTSDIARLGLTRLVDEMDTRGDVAFLLFIQGRSTVPQGADVLTWFKKAMTVTQPPAMVKAALALPAQRAKLRVRMDPTPARTSDVEGRAMVEVYGKVCLAPLLGLPAVDPVAEVRALAETWERLAGYWGPTPSSFETWRNRACLQVVKKSDALSKGGHKFRWCGESVAPDADDRFAQELEREPLLAGWIRTLQEGLAALRVGPHSWLTLTADHIRGDAEEQALMHLQYRPQVTASGSP